MTSLPRHARAVIIGGGIVGNSTAYHLAKLGWEEVVVLERCKLTSGSTFHAAGLVGQLRSSASITQLLKYSVELYGTLEQETELATGWKQNGGLRLACNAERFTEVKRQATTAHSFGLEMHVLGPREARELWPVMQVDDVVGAAFLPTDGQVSPSDITQSLAKGARMRGVRAFEDCPVTAIRVARGRVTGVSTPHGDIECEVVVNCAGLWSRRVGALAGVNVPVQAMQHQFIVTEPIPGVPRNLPTLRDPDRLIYFKEEVGGLVMGGYEPNPIPWGIAPIPDDFHFQLLQPDFDHFGPTMEQALARCPPLHTAGVRKLINGPEAFTPDGSFILGEAPEVRGFFVGAGFNAYGIAAAGGAGRALAEWIHASEPPMDLWPVDIRRFGKHHRDKRWVLERTTEAYAHHYTMVWPFEEHETGRPLRVSPLYQRLVSQGACFGSKMGWERPNWFAPPGVEPRDEYTYGRQNWFEHVRHEHEATRSRVAVFDQTSFAKFLLVGRDVERVLSWLCANDVAKPVGRLVYTQMCNRRGGIECDVTVARLAEDAYYIVTGTGYVTHDADWITRNIPADAEARLVDVTGMMSVLGVMGPRARDVLSRVTDADLANAVFPFGTFQEIPIGGAMVRAMRVTFVGELGWELHVPVEAALSVYERIWRAGEDYGIKSAGYRAIDSLRLEKGYKNWGSDLTPDDSPLEAGHAWAVKLSRDMAFIGREALAARRARPLQKRMATFTVDDPKVVLLGRETIYRDDVRVGYLTSGGYGYTVEKSIGLGYVRQPGDAPEDFLQRGRYELEVAGDRVPCQLHLSPLYESPDVSSEELKQAMVPPIVTPAALLERLDRELDAIPRPRPPAARGGPLMAFDADGTLWSGDIGVDVFEALMRVDGVREDARSALEAEAREFGIRVAGTPSQIARALDTAVALDVYPEARGLAMVAWAFAGWEAAAVEAFADEVVAAADVRSRIHREVVPLLDWAARHGIEAWIVSASPRAMAVAAARLLGIVPERVLAMTPAIEGGRIAPRLVGAVTYDEGKRAALRAARPEALVLGAFGDSLYDAAMLCEARVPVAVYPKPSLVAAARSIPNLLVLA